MHQVPKSVTTSWLTDPIPTNRAPPNPHSPSHEPILSRGLGLPKAVNSLATTQRQSNLATHLSNLLEPPTQQSQCARVKARILIMYLAQASAKKLPVKAKISRRLSLGLITIASCARAVPYWTSLATRPSSRERATWTTFISQGSQSRVQAWLWTRRRDRGSSRWQKLFRKRKCQNYHSYLDKFLLIYPICMISSPLNYYLTFWLPKIDKTTSLNKSLRWNRNFKICSKKSKWANRCTRKSKCKRKPSKILNASSTNSNTRTDW